MPDGREEPKAQAPVGKRALGADCGAHRKRTLHGVGGASPKWLTVESNTILKSQTRSGRLASGLFLNCPSHTQRKDPYK